MRSRGFTLIEIMVALFIFTIIAVIATTSLQGLLRARARTAANSERLGQLQFTISLIGYDLANLSQRSITASDGQKLAALTGDSLKHYLEFTSGGRTNPNALEKRSTLGRVAYLLSHHKLIRRTWPRLDRAKTNQYHDRPLLNKIEQFNIKFLDSKHRWQLLWPTTANNNSNELPLAVKITLKLQDWGTIRRIYLIAVTPDEQT